MVPLRTNFILLPDSVYLAAANAFAPDVQIRFDDARLGRGFVEPQWGLAVTNRVRVIVRDIQSGRIIDYVQLAGLNGIRDLSGEIRTPDNELGFAGLWSTNRQGGQGINFPPIGVVNQVQISLGNYNASAVDWRDYGVNQPTSPKKEEEIDKFRAFFGLSPLWYPGTVNTNLNAQVPFTPTRKVSQYLTWQANDPLVHYLSGDLQSLDTTNNVRIENLNLPVETLENIGRLNNRYSPWGGNPFLTGGAGDASTDAHANDIAVKDPQVFTSDDWDFPTNFFPNVGALGRIHRGTPWQTVYMKAGNIAATDFPSWKRWTGNNFDGDNDAKRMAPIEDRTLFDVFTAAINENASRGQLSVNQTNFAAWSAVLSGVITLANTNTPDDLVNRQLLRPPPPLQYDPVVIQPMGTNTTGSMARILQAIHDVRATNVYTRAVNGNLQATFGNFQRAGDILNVPELSDASPFLDRSTELHTQYGISDAAYERIPQQIMSLLTLSHEPRFLIYAYGQALRPAERSILTSGPYFGMCTNYAVVGESALRAVVRVEGSPDPRNAGNADPHLRYPPRVVVENFNILPPD
jgi:hypothetical protein